MLKNSRFPCPTLTDKCDTAVTISIRKADLLMRSDIGSEKNRRRVACKAV
jgi:hypothetical protein